MAKMILRQDNNPYYSGIHAVEAFFDIFQAAGFKTFDNLELDETGAIPTLTYTVVDTGSRITKEFNPDTYETDIVTFLFSMLDAAANL